MAPVVASPEKETVARAPPVPVPVAWATSFAAGTTWQSPQEIAVLRRLVPVRCLPWAPTAAAVAAVAPVVSAALALKPGAEAPEVAATAVWVRSPWQRVQPVRLTLTVPSTWVAWTTVVAEYPAPWQDAQLALAGWWVVAFSAGGLPWQEVQASAPRSSRWP